MSWRENPAYQKELEENCRLALPYEQLRGCNILVTGAGGLIGSYLVDTFLKMNEIMGLGLCVTALCHSSGKAAGRFADYLDRGDFEITAGDISQIQTLKQSRFYGSWDYVIHCAGNAHPRAFAMQPVETMKANLMGTINLLEEAAARQESRPVRRILFLSSGEVYGSAAPGSQQGWRECEAGTVDSMAPRSCYPEGKRAAETLCVSYVREYGISVTVARAGYIYGATMQEDNTRADVQFISRAAAGMPIVMKSAGTQYRSYCYLQDAAAGLLLLLLKGESGQAYNIANPDSKATVREFAETIAQAFGVPVLFEKPEELEQQGYSTMKQEILDAGRLFALGWTPEKNLRQGAECLKTILSGRKETGERKKVRLRVDNAVIMAAGLSSRFRPVSDKIPKALIRVRGEVLIERQIRQLREAGINEIVVVTGYKKECMSYLEDKYGVILIENREYQTRNNNGSLYAARDYLKNTYICSADNYFTVNPFQNEEEDSYYAAVFTTDQTDEWCMETDGDGRITKVTIGGEDSWYMLGHAFFSSTFSDSFRSILEEEYHREETRHKLWEAVFAEHISELPMKIKPYKDTEIYEFDSIEDVQKFDEEYRELSRDQLMKRLMGEEDE